MSYLFIIPQFHVEFVLAIKRVSFVYAAAQLE